MRIAIIGAGAMGGAMADGFMKSFECMLTSMSGDSLYRAEPSDE